METTMTYLILPLAVAVVSGAILFFVGRWYENQKNAVQYIEYIVTKTSNIIDKVPSKNIEIKVNDRPVKNMGVFQMSLYNRTNRDFENLEIDFYFQRIQNKEAVFNLIDVDLKDEFDNITVLTDVREKNQATFQFKSFTRDKEKAIHTFSFLVEEIEDSDCVLNINKAGVRITRKEEIESKKQFSKAGAQILTFLLAIISFFIVSYVTVNRNEQGQQYSQILRSLDSLGAERQKAILQAQEALKDYRNLRVRLDSQNLVSRRILDSTEMFMKAINEKLKNKKVANTKK